MPIKCVLFTQINDANVISSLVYKINSAGAGVVSAVMIESPQVGFLDRALKHIKKYGVVSLAYKIVQLSVLKFFSFISRLNFATLRIGKEESNLSLENFCTKGNIVFLKTASFSSKESIQFLSKLNADLGIVCGTGILKKDFFSIPRLGSINIHKRKLPDYRGGGAIGLWELLAGEKQLGITVHKVSEKLDSGDIVAEAVLPIQDRDTLVSLKLKADLIGDDLIVRAIELIASGSPCKTQISGTGRLFREPSPARFSYYKALLYLRMLSLQGINFKEILKRILKVVYLCVSLTPLRALISRLRGRAPIIIFYGHLVSERNHYMALRTRLFRKYVDYLKRHYDIISLSEAVRRIKAGQNFQPAIVLTFDDGYHENMLNLRAALYGTDVKVAFFISTDYIGTDKYFTHDISKGIMGFYPFSWEDVTLLHDEGHEIGSHTRTHTRCSRLEELPEIKLSKLDIEKHLKSPVMFFSFPWGKKKHVLPEAFEEVKDSGYQAAFLADSGNALNYKNDIFAIERTPLPVSGSLIDLEVVIYGWNEVAKFKEKLLEIFRH